MKKEKISLIDYRNQNEQPDSLLKIVTNIPVKKKTNKIKMVYHFIAIGFCCCLFVCVGENQSNYLSNSLKGKSFLPHL